MTRDELTRHVLGQHVRHARITSGRTVRAIAAAHDSLHDIMECDHWHDPAGSAVTPRKPVTGKGPQVATVEAGASGRLSSWTHQLRAYVTLAGESDATIVDTPDWPEMAGYLQSGEFTAMADRVLAVTVVNRSPLRSFDPMCGCPSFPLRDGGRWVGHCGGCDLPREPEPDWVAHLGPEAL